MDIKLLTVPQECYPRYNYTLKYARKLWKRYETFMDNLDITDEFPLPTFGTVSIVCLRKPNTYLQENLLVASKGTDRISCRSANHDAYLRAIKDSKSHGATIFVVSSEIFHGKEELQLIENRIIVIGKTKRERLVARDCQEFLISPLQELPKNIDLHLERNVIETFYERMKVLECLLQLKAPNASFDRENDKRWETLSASGKYYPTRVPKKRLERQCRLYTESKLEFGTKEANDYGKRSQSDTQIVTRSRHKQELKSRVQLKRKEKSNSEKEDCVRSEGRSKTRKHIQTRSMKRKHLERSYKVYQKLDSAAKEAITSSQQPGCSNKFTPRLVENNIMDNAFSFRAYLEGKLNDALKHIEKQYRNASSKFRDNLINSLMSKRQSRSYMSDREMIRYLTKHNQGEVTELEIQAFFRDDSSNVKEMYDLVSEEHHLKEAFKEHVEKVSSLHIVAEQLHAEMKGMLYRSSVPASDMPKFEIDTIKVLSKTVAQEILKVKGVTSVGYRFQTLDIFLDDTCDDEKRLSAEKAIKQILTKRNIPKYRLRYEQKTLTMFREVGSALSIHNKATLGGFAKLGNNEEICILLARHFASQGSFVFVENGQERSLFARVLPFRNEIQISTDIAIAKVVESEQNNCQFYFKDDSGNPMPSTLCLFEDLQWLNALPVYIWGASSRPGHGVIVGPVHYMANEEDPVLRIEDQEPVQGQNITRFARLGDSGAIVCAERIGEDTVTVMAMFSGSPNFSYTEANPHEKRHYIAFRLNLGLDQLQREHDRAVTLY